MQRSLARLILAFTRSATAESGGRGANRFVVRYYANVASEDIAERPVRDLAGAALAHLQLARQWQRGHHTVRIYNPRMSRHGWQSQHTIVEVTTGDRPFLVDSLVMVLNRHGFTNHLVIHPVMRIKRDAKRQLIEVCAGSAPDERSVKPESFIHIEIDRETDPDRLRALRGDLEKSLTDVRRAVADWPRMLERVARESDAIRPAGAALDDAVAAESRAFLQWLAADNFTFLGVREYCLSRTADGVELRTVGGSGLGILRQAGEGRVSASFAETPVDLRLHDTNGTVLMLAKSNSRSTVHRSDYFDYIGVKRYDARGEVAGELRILGLYTSAAHFERAREIPVVRDKVAAVLAKLDLTPQGYDSKALTHIFDTWPRAELFEADVQHLAFTALGILQLQERQRVRLFVRADAFGRYFACQLFVPRDHLDTSRHVMIQQILREALDGTQVDFTLALSEAPLARLYFVVRTAHRTRRRLSIARIERRITTAIKPWQAKLMDALTAAHGEEIGTDLYKLYAEAFSVAYRADHDAVQAVTDIAFIEAAQKEQRIQTNIESTGSDGAEKFVFKLFSPGDIVELSAILPVLENMGVSVLLELPYKVSLARGGTVWIHDHECRVSRELPPLTGTLQDSFEEAIAAVWYGEVENDALNALVLQRGMAARKVAVLRTYVRYLRQTGTPYSTEFMLNTLVVNGVLAQQLYDLFETRFVPARERAGALVTALCASIEAALDSVAGLDEDRILRSIYRMILATTRTNYFQHDANGAAKPQLAIKLTAEKLPELPAPRPAYEIFVCSPRVEGVHLRGGKVARGGLRWSDRREDYRTEILGLMKAQTVKNAVIVPVGAKGGFYVKQAPAAARERQREGIACYQTFIRGLLDVTDNYRDGMLEAPADTVCYDGDDPYLVVAADKGTAKFSDLANDISREYGFWLGDAFASGGSSGYDHKKMGITARGAWESVRHAFQIRNRDVQKQDFTVVGIGDMAGDVFGNGMLRSRHTKLVAAFNHAHIFIDPDPDPASSMEERRRLFRMKTSSWDDYDRALISEGGGIYLRSAKSINLSLPARAALGTDIASATPDEVIQILLTAPVDLLWNGGIGTYVKARAERHQDVGDKSNDRVRVDAESLRCSVVGEGGNLGFTQVARVRFATNGGLINADWIDNSAGVDTSDHEVNIKILLNRVVARGNLSIADRNVMLRRMRPAVAGQVLNNNYRQVRAISHERTQSERYADRYRFAIDELVKTHGLDRALEELPSDDLLRERVKLGGGLCRPELAALIAYTKIALYRDVIATALPEEEFLLSILHGYFPAPIQQAYPRDVGEHPLRREIITTVLVNELVNRMGIPFVFLLAEDTGESPDAIVAAFLVVRVCLEVEEVWDAIDAMDFQVPVDCQRDMILITRRVLERATKWLLLQGGSGDSIAARIARFRPGCARLRSDPDALLPAAIVQRIDADTAALRSAGVVTRLAGRVARFAHMDWAFGLTRMTERTGRPFARVAACAAAVDDHFCITGLRELVDRLPASDIWEDRARGAIINSVNVFHTNVATDAVRAGGYRKWLKAFGDKALRMRSIVDEISLVDAPDLSRLLVLTSQLRSLS